MSLISLSDGAGGEIHSFCAMYSFKMSFCKVPRSFLKRTPCRSATTRYIANNTIAGPLMVIDTLTRSKGMSRKSVSMSATESMATPHRPTSPLARG